MKKIRLFITKLLSPRGVRTRMWQLLTCCLLAAMPMLTSCGELFDVDEAGETTSATMKMDRDTVFIMPGDSLRLTVTFSPPEVKDKGVMWLIDQPEIARLCADTLVAQQPGTAYVTAMSSATMRLDTCVVTVMTPWTVDRNKYFFDTVVYADISVAGRQLGDDIAVAAFVDDELRGIAELKEAKGKRYAVIRVYGPVSASDEDIITFKCYDRREVRLRTFDVQLPFDGETHGTLSKLITLHLD